MFAADDKTKINFYSIVLKADLGIHIE